MASHFTIYYAKQISYIRYLIKYKISVYICWTQLELALDLGTGPRLGTNPQSKIIVLPVSEKKTSSLHMSGCFTSNKTFLASVEMILDSWKFVLRVTLRRQTH